MTVNFLDLKKQYNTLDKDVLFKKIEDLISDGKFVGGDALNSFEKNFARYNNADYAVGVGSGTDALIFALAGVGVGPGDEVIIPANTFIATALAVTHLGATPVFCDVNPLTFLMDASVENFITDKTKALIPVHLYGNPVNMDTIMTLAAKYQLKVIEDCAQAVGATFSGKHVGTFGNAGAFSFYPAKNLGGIGQGGMIITHDENIVDKARCLGNVGRKKGSWYEYDEVGYNSRLDAINAVFLNTCLEYIDLWNRKRRTVARWYASELDSTISVKTPYIDTNSVPVWHLYELQLRTKLDRDGLHKFLLDENINCALHYPIPCHKQKVYSEYNNLTLGVVESLAFTLLSLPMHPFMTKDEVIEVCNAIKEYFN